MSTPSDTQTTPPAGETLRAELAQTEEKLRKLVRHIDQLGRTEFRDRAQRLKQMREQRAELEAEIDTLKSKLK
jgi:chromosome segregation ATPase